jgi:hypothetical protein
MSFKIYDFCVMENAPIKLATNISNNFTEHDSTSSLESLTNNANELSEKNECTFLY